jgi:sugar lactone lactonase YvrE
MVGTAGGIEVRVAVRAHARVGEGPVWDAAARRLRWVDIPAGTVHASRPDTGETDSVDLSTQVGAVALDSDGGLVVACEEGFGTLTATGVFEVRLANLPAGRRMNDAKCDAAGRLWAGSTELDFAPGEGALHVLRPDWSSDVVLDGLTLPNGLGWSPDSRLFYLADSVRRVIEAFDFDLERARLSARRTLIDFGDRDAMPDGLCVDAAGCLWVAMWDGAEVLRVSPRGEVLATVPVPVHRPSSCAFGGDGLDTLYVTSARDDRQDPTGVGGSVLAVTGTGATAPGATSFGRPGPVRRASPPAGEGRIGHGPT